MLGKNTSSSLMGYQLILVSIFITMALTKGLKDICAKPCSKNVDMERVSEHTHSVCEYCGNMWGNMVGLYHCCICHKAVYDKCDVAVNRMLQ